MDRNRLRSLLTRVGSQASENPESPSAESFDWRQCRYFNASMFETIQQEVTQVLQDMAERIGAVCQDDFTVELKDLAQQYAGEPLEQVKAMTTGDYGMTFGPDEDRLEALLMMPTKTASQWANFALGASGGEGQDEGDSLLSSLELSFLTDLSKAMIQPWARLCGLQEMATAPEAGNGPAQVPWTGVDALLCLTIEVKKGEAEDGSEGRLMIPCPWMALHHDEEEYDDLEEGPSAEAIVKKCLLDYPVPVQVQFGTLEMSFEELASLGVNDILMLDRRIDEPVEIQVCNQWAFAGTPAQRRGHKVVMITQAH